jgi:hypothetical protein
MNHSTAIFASILFSVIVGFSAKFDQLSDRTDDNCEKYYEENLFKQAFSSPLQRKLETKSNYILEIIADGKIKKISLLRTKKTDELFGYIIEKDLVSKGSGDHYISIARFDKNGGIEVKRFTDLCR